MSDNPKTICAECEHFGIVLRGLYLGCALTAWRDSVTGATTYERCFLVNGCGRCSKFTPRRTIRRRVLDLFSRRKEGGKS